jgi:IS5 family transposase
MFKSPVPHTMYNFSDKETEYQMLDFRTYPNFLGMKTASDVPDHHILWKFREESQKRDLFKKIYNKFCSFLVSNGLILKKGTIVDAIFVTAPKPRNTRKENGAIQEGKTPTGFETKSAQRQSHDDTDDTRWSEQNGKTYSGHKLHITTDSGSVLVVPFEVTPASDHDFRMLFAILPDRPYNGEPLDSDSAHDSESILSLLKSPDISPQVCERGCRGLPLTTEQQRRHQGISRKCSRLEHVFVCMTQHGSKVVRTIGLSRAKAKAHMSIPAFHVRRFVFLTSQPRSKRVRIALFQ